MMQATSLKKKQTNKSKNKPTSLLLLLHVGCPQEGSAGVSTWLQPEPELNHLPQVPQYPAVSNCTSSLGQSPFILQIS